MASASSTKISWRLSQFEAHSSSVSCLSLGKKTVRLLATGGEDCRVNVWCVSKPNCIMSMAGHSKPVECVLLSPSEDKVIAGSQSGSIRLWDLETAKSIKTLPGHKSNITSLDLYSNEVFLASSAVDKDIKLWDMRRSGCVVKFQGHTQAVRSVAFSPDGKWLASSSDDGTIKLWDLFQSKMITEFKTHTAAVNVVQFHPNEYLLASGSSDKTVKLWDLEKFTPVGSLEGHTSPVRCISFSPAGDCLYSGSSDTLRVFGWEPDCCFDTVAVGWGEVADMALWNDQLISASHHLSVVSSYVVDLKKVKKNVGSVIQGIVQDNKPLKEPQAVKAAPLRKSYERPMTTCITQRVKLNADSDRRSPEGERRSPSEEQEKAVEKVPPVEIPVTDDYEEIFQPKKAICRTPPEKAEPFPAPSEDVTILDISKQLNDMCHFPVTQMAPPPLPVVTPVQRVVPTVVSGAKRPALPVIGRPTSNPEPPAPTAKTKPQPKIVLNNREEPIGLNISDFLSVSHKHRKGDLSMEEALTQMMQGSETMYLMMSSRRKKLEKVHSVWSKGELTNAVDAAVAMKDLSIVVDILNIINLQPSLWKLDVCMKILPQIDELLQTAYESYIQTGYKSLKLIMKHFWTLISDTLNAPQSVGVDITREERHQKCSKCCKLLKNLSNTVKNRVDQVGRHGSTFKELQLLLAPLDDLH
ncbi:katanin p80 WD40 repeat-containing subunit B1 [Neosynchiropus ocellatus]